MSRQTARFLVAAFALALITAGPAYAEDGPESTADLRPARSLQKFLRVARKTKRFEDILPFLPRAEQKRYELMERAFDKTAVRDALSGTSVFGSAGAIDLLAQSPFEKGVAEHRAIAKRIKKYIGTEIKGTMALIRVEAQVGDARLPATVTMTREGSVWKFADFTVDFNL